MVASEDAPEWKIYNKYFISPPLAASGGKGGQILPSDGQVTQPTEVLASSRTTQAPTREGGFILSEPQETRRCWWITQLPSLLFKNSF